MHHGRRLSLFPASRFSTRELDFAAPPRAAEFRYRHLLVSTSLTRTDRAALLLGFELAALHQARLTLLHVPPAEPDSMPHGFDAIGLLHSAADELRGTPAATTPGKARPKLRKFIDDIIPDRLLDAVDWQSECRPGPFTDTIVSLAQEQAADLVILPAKPSRWWRPTVPFAVWNIQRRVRANVIVIRGQAPALPY